jgi:hypothetical protein
MFVPIARLGKDAEEVCYPQIQKTRENTLNGGMTIAPPLIVISSQRGVESI